MSPLAGAVRAWESRRFSELLGEQNVVGRPGTVSDADQLRRLRVYALLRLPLGLIEATVFIAVFVAPLAVTAMVVTGVVFRWTNPGVGPRYLLALLVLPLTPPLLAWLTRLDVVLASSLLGGDRELLEARLSAIVAGRLRDQDAVQSERELLERDLHDGAQQHLIALAAQLGRLERSMVRRAAASEDVAELRRSREGAIAVVAEIRSLTRGLRPHLLQARGLGPALEAVAGRLGMPCRVEVGLTVRPEPMVERALYFACCELVTNLAKHSHAHSASLLIREENRRIVCVIHDDGRGGARLEAGGGLEGVAQRIASVGGTMTLSSPLGGPTCIRLEVPCE